MARPRLMGGGMIAAKVLHGAVAQGPVLKLDEPLSFWGAFEPRTGIILDVHHPQRGKCVAGTILLMRESRGSGSAPGAIAEAIRLGTAPAAIILVKPDVNLAIGAEVAETLYGKPCAVLAVSETEFATLCGAAHLRITREGGIYSAG
ncbi:aconitase X swivel domain-containing protein [Aestuariivirga sp.]|uniref:aconitase X swivel domain-containing protein n=1 Tax=Aestuariivirga sp. TaxID=2650926 RepID=UPI0039E5FE15